MNRYQQLLLGIMVAGIGLVWSPTEAHASWIELWARGDGNFLGGSADLNYIENNEAGLGYGFAVGVEVLQIDFFFDANFYPEGAAFNLAGIGFDMDLLPMMDSLVLAPSGQLAYFYGPHDDATEQADYGFIARAGVQLEVKIFPMAWLGVEGFGGGAFSMPESETGWIYSASAYAMFRFGL